MFVDRVNIVVKAGKGGDGCVAFRREKYIPRGGPSGGNGGDGGDVILRPDENMTTLMDFYYRHTYGAGNGKPGEGSNRKGADGEDKVIEVPPGTVVTDEKTGRILADIVEKPFVAALGGRGGRGNASFKTSSNQAPRKSTPGKEGEERNLVLELKIIADVGLVGAPNAGKSTLLSRISRARPKVASYPFTTLEPNLGIVELDAGRRFTVCDVPGLIEGAHRGKGLGLEFLRHVERNNLLLLLIDLTGEPEQALRMLHEELESYADGVLAKKPKIVVGTKLDAADRDRNWLNILGEDAFLISSVTGEGLQKLMEATHSKVRKLEKNGR